MTASGLSRSVLQGALSRAETVPEIKHVVDMASTAVEACKRTRRGISETNEYAVVAVQAIVKAGELLASLEKDDPVAAGRAGPGRGNKKTAATVAAVSSYRQAIEDAALGERTARYWQGVAKVSHRLPEYVQTCRDNDDIVSWRGLLGVELDGVKSSTSVEWYTPVDYIDAARDVMGSIDLDPASSEIANQTVGADTYFSKDDEPDGLSQDWFGNVWLNPPYGKGSGLFTAKLVGEYEAKRIDAAVLLLNAYGFDAAWFQPLWQWPICFTDHRIEFYSPQRESGGPANGNILVYLGPDQRRFADVFRQFGRIVREWAA